MAQQRQSTRMRQLAPLDLPMVPFVAGGIAIWFVLGLILLAFRSSLVEAGRDEWIWICACGVLSGLPGLALMVVHDRNRRRRLRATQTSTVDG